MMEKKESNIMTRSGDDELHENPWGYNVHQYSKLFVNVMVRNYSRTNETEALTFCASISDDLYRDKLKAGETLRARLINLVYTFDPKDVALLFFLCRTTMKAAKRAKYRDQLFSSFHSTDMFFKEHIDLENFHVLVDLAATQLKNIKVYNSKSLALLEVENLNEETLHEVSNHYSSFYKGLRSLNIQVAAVMYHLKNRQRDLETLVDIFSTSVEGELRQYEKELETTRLKLFQLAKTKIRLRWLPDSWKGKVLSLQLFSAVMGKIEYHTINTRRSNETKRTL